MRRTGIALVTAALVVGCAALLGIGSGRVGPGRAGQGGAASGDLAAVQRAASGQGAASGQRSTAAPASAFDREQFRRRLPESLRGVSCLVAPGRCDPTVRRSFLPTGPMPRTPVVPVPGSGGNAGPPMNLPQLVPSLHAYRQAMNGLIQRLHLPNLLPIGP